MTQLKLGARVRYQNPGYPPKQGVVEYIRPGFDGTDTRHVAVSARDFKARILPAAARNPHGSVPGFASAKSALAFCTARFIGDRVSAVIIRIPRFNKDGKRLADEYRSPPLCRLKVLREGRVEW